MQFLLNLGTEYQRAKGYIRSVRPISAEELYIVLFCLNCDTYSCLYIKYLHFVNDFIVPLCSSNDQVVNFLHELIC